MADRKSWLAADAEDLDRVAAKHANDPDVQRLVRIAKCVTWILRMHRHFRGSFSARNGVGPPLGAWDEMVAEVLGDESADG
jgi:hypothetical protein